MTLPQSSETDRLAQAILSELLAKSCLVRKQDPDVHVDYEMEAIEDQHPTGIRFLVQLKGTRSPKISGESVVQQLKTSHAKYYLEKARQPVFLFVLDVVTRRAYYLFLQKYLRELPNGKAWTSRTTMSIFVPVSNLFVDEAAFLIDIKNAEKYVRDLWPSSIKASVESEKARFESLDDRFNYDINYHDGSTHVVINAKKSVQVVVRSFGLQAKKKLQRVVNAGMPVRFEKNEISFEGAPVFEAAMGESGAFPITLSFTKRQQLGMSFTLHEGDGTSSSLHGIDGEFRGGQTSGKFVGRYPGAPLNFTMKSKFSGTQLKLSNFIMNFPLHSWDNSKVSDLPYFDQIFRLVTHIVEGKLVTLVCESNGNRLLSVELHSGNVADLKWLFHFLTLISRARHVAKIFSINPKLPPVDKIGPNEHLEINKLFELYTIRRFRYQAPFANFKCTVLVSKSLFDQIGKPVPISVNSPNEPFDFLGERVEGGAVKISMTSMKLEQADNSKMGDYQHLSWVATEENEILFERIDPE